MKPVPLAACDAADAARNLAALLAPAPPATGLILAEDHTPLLRALRRRLTATRWQGREFSPEASPEAEEAADTVILFDGVALLPRAARPALVAAALRLARRELIVTAPLGTDLQRTIETSLARYHRELLGREHAYLSAHLRHGLPMPDEALAWGAPGQVLDLGYAGDVLLYRQMAERLIQSRRLGFPRGLLRHLLSHLLPESERLDLTLETVPMRRHRRLYLHMRRT